MLISQAGARWATAAQVAGAVGLILGSLYMVAAPVGADPGLPHPSTPGPSRPVGTSSGWLLEQTINPLLPGGALSAVACPSPIACIAVGSSSDATGNQVTLAEVWDGTVWTVQTTPNPAGATNITLAGVSCTSVTACTAVGSYTNVSGNQVTLAEAWNGTAWALEITLNPAGATASGLNGVSCSSTSCTAVGNYTNSSGKQFALAEGWNGTAWAVQTTPSPAGATAIRLNGASCSSATACTAVGSYLGSSGWRVPLAEGWNGSAWAIQTTPNPPFGGDTSLDGVSCSSATACTVVGSIGTTPRRVAIAEAWDGTAWTLQTVPQPANSWVSPLSGVSCVSATACTAVGSYLHNSGGAITTLVEVWDGSAWTIKTTPNPGDAYYSVLGGVSCSSATACIAVGHHNHGVYTSLTLAEAWNGTRWRIQTTANPAGATDTELYGVSCISATTCIAVGTYRSISGKHVTLAELWNGTAWVLQTTPNPVGAGWSQLNGVSCTSATACIAVGYTTVFSNWVTLAEVWNGTAWSLLTTPNPAGGGNTVLRSVSCSSATACTAVGTDGTIPRRVTVAEAWDGTAWSLQTTPTPAGALSPVLDGVSCSSAAACIAVGYYEKGTGSLATLAEAWDGTNWAVQTTPSTGSTFNGVSCTSATSCTAVGSITETWNGTAWVVQPTPYIAGATLNGVSCHSATACTAVGSSGTNPRNNDVTLAEVWDGTAWAVEPTANPSDASSSFLYGVSCSSATACTAVGYDHNVRGVDQTFGEAEHD